MTDIETTTVSEEGYASTSQVGDFELSIDATEETGPGPNGVLVADYASCFLPAFRVGGEDICHVHAALKPELHAEISVHGGAF